MPRLWREGDPSYPLRRTQRARWQVNEHTLALEGLTGSGRQSPLLMLLLMETVTHWHP